MVDSLPARSASSDGDMWWLRSLWHGLEGLKTRRALRAARWTADVELLRRGDPPLRLSWRVEELVTPKNRLDLAHTLRSLVRDASPRYLMSASPFNRLAVRAEAETLLTLAARVADLERPVAARGILLVERLLVDGSGPLYDRERVDELPPYLDTALAALEPR
jgi:hypothetical protein